MTPAELQIAQLRGQRNLAAAGAVLLAALAMLAAAPGLARRKAQAQALNARLVSLQGDISAVQRQAVALQGEIILTQDQIRNLLRRAR